MPRHYGNHLRYPSYYWTFERLFHGKVVFTYVYGQIPIALRPKLVDAVRLSDDIQNLLLGTEQTLQR